jgi:hypothetical protein
MIDELRRAFENVVDRIRNLEANERSEVTGAVVALVFASLPAAGQAGRLLFVTDGRKTGEGAAAGTGVLAYDDGVGWRRVDDGTTVAV